MFRNYLILCLFGLSACFLSGTVGREAILDGTVVHRPQDYAYQASLLHNNHVYCGGGIIGDKFIVTAARCVLTRDGQLREKHMSILVGTTDKQKRDYPALVVRVAHIFVPVEFDPKNPHGPADIAVLKLAQSLQLASNFHLKKLELPRVARANYTGEIATIAGFGWDWYNYENQSGGYTDNRLRYAVTDVIDRCDPGYRFFDVPGRHICAKMTQIELFKPRGICNNDNGGPLVHFGTVIGIVSIASKHCSERMSGALYTPVSYYLPFVRHSMDYKRNMHHLEIHDYEL